MHVTQRYLRRRRSVVLSAFLAACVVALANIVPALATVGTGWTSDTSLIHPTGTNGGREGNSGVQLLSGSGGATGKPCLDGYVLFAGGETTGQFGTNGTASALTDCWDPSTTSTSANAAGTMNTARADEALFQVPDIGTVCPDKIIAAGGYVNQTGTNNVTASSEKYDPTTDAWTNLATSLSTARWGLDLGRGLAELPDGRFLVAGGATTTGTSQSPTNAVDIFDSKQCAWNENDSGTAITPATMSTSRSYPAMGVLAPDSTHTFGRVIVCGGFVNTNPDPTTSCEIYTPPDPTTTGGGSWATGPSVAHARGSMANAAYGVNDTSCSSGGVTDYSCNERLGDGNVLLATGAKDHSFNVTSDAQECNATSCATATTVSLAVSYPDAVRLHAGTDSGDVLLCGGFPTGTTLTDNCQLYNGTTWSQNSAVNTMPRQRADSLMIETCGGSPSKCPTGVSDEVTNAGGIGSITNSGNNYNELRDVDSLTT